jgi:ABC-2 type transport system permease protein
MTFSLAETWTFWRYVGKLLRLEGRVLLNGFFRAKRRQKIGQLVLLILASALFVSVFVGSWWILGLLRSPRLPLEIGNLAELIEMMPGLILTAGFLGILLTSFGVLLQGLYLAGDMEFLLSAPVPLRAVFVAKLLMAVLPNFLLVALLGLPILYGLGLAYQYNLLYYPLVLIVMVALTLCAAGMSSLVVMAVVRIFPARRVAEVLAVLGAVFSMLCSQSGQLFNAFGRDVNVSNQQVANNLQLLTRLNPSWSPLGWGGRGLVELGAGRWASGLLFLALTLGLAGGVFWFSLTTAERLYYSGWARVQVGGRRKKPRPTETAASAAAAPASPLAFIPTPIRALISKDWLLLRRDLRNMSQIIMPLIFGVMYAFIMLRRGQVNEIDSASMRLLVQNFVTYGGVALALFVSMGMVSRLALMGFSQEGKYYWLLKSAPLSANRLLVSKFLAAYLPSLVLASGMLLLIALIQQGRPLILAWGFLVILLWNAGETGLSLALGIQTANLKWKNPDQMTRGSSCLWSLISLSYLILSFAAFFLPPGLLLMLKSSEILGLALGLVLGGSLSLVCVIVPPSLVYHKIARLGEE